MFSGRSDPTQEYTTNKNEVNTIGKELNYFFLGRLALTEIRPHGIIQYYSDSWQSDEVGRCSPNPLSRGGRALVRVVISTTQLPKKDRSTVPPYRTAGACSSNLRKLIFRPLPPETFGRGRLSSLASLP